VSVSIDLNGKWKLSWKALEGFDGVPECPEPIVGHVPGDVHEDLIRAEILPEPLVGANAPKHEWVEKALFAYGRGITIDSDFDRAELVFNGLDCFADVYLDSQKVGESANAFVPFTFDITSQVEKGEAQQLKVTLDTGVQWAKKQDLQGCKNDDNMERMFLRKSQFSFKWDWAPRLVTCGIWRDAEIKLYKHAAIRDVVLIPSFDGDAAVLNAEVQVEVYNQMGQLVKNLTSKQQLFQGTHRLFWNGSNEENNHVSTGVYHLKLIMNNEIHFKRIIYSE